MYQLADFGDGRKLEKFAQYWIDRPAPAATLGKSHPELWESADARFEIVKHREGRWDRRKTISDSWFHETWFGRIKLDLSPFGHLGVFPEQHRIWDWFKGLSSAISGSKILNLFAYTGGSTLALAKLGGQVTHVDSASNTVKRARINAGLSNLGNRPIRWIVEDVMKFVRREIKRGNHYDGVVLDPPSYGKGPKRETWQIDRDLPILLDHLAELCQNHCQLFVLTCHSPGYDAGLLERMVASAELGNPGEYCGGELSIPSADGRELPAGTFVYFAGDDAR